jgi:hypothetical protein
MKFAKGILTEPEETRPEAAPAAAAPGARTERPAEAPRTTTGVEKDRLFQTVNESERSGKKYLILLFAVCCIVAVVASAAWYAMRPGIGDRVTPPRGLELAIRDHFLQKEKRVATDIAFHLCDGYYWARVGVETRTDLPNPLMRVDTYAASARESDGSWSITARPGQSPEVLVPCSTS